MAKKRANQPGYMKAKGKDSRTIWVPKNTKTIDEKPTTLKQDNLLKNNNLKKIIWNKEHLFEDKSIEEAIDQDNYITTNETTEINYDSIKLYEDNEGKQHIQVECTVTYDRIYDPKPHGQWEGTISLPLDQLQ